jgi:hypothetical protein
LNEKITKKLGDDDVKNLLKAVASLCLVFSMLVGFSPATHASESQKPPVDIAEKTVIDLNLDSMDLSKPVTETKEYKDAEGNPYTLEMKFTPAKITTQGTSTNPATVGTWTSSFKGGILNMSYQFDLSKSGSQWVISNARNHDYNGVFMTFSNAKLEISRAKSTASFPAEINASVDISVFDNQWVKLYNSKGIMYTQVDNGGTMTLYWN